jgi:hypothetical protein
VAPNLPNGSVLTEERLTQRIDVPAWLRDKFGVEQTEEMDEE